MSFGIPVRNGLAIGLLASTTLSSRRGLSPAMSLNFLQPFLDSRITFSRGSNATLVDATGKITYAPANLVSYSQEFDNAYWVKTSLGVAVVPIVTTNAGVAPDGTNTADRIQFDCVNTGSSGNRSYISAVLSYPTAVKYIASVWVKAFDVGNVGRTVRFAVDGLTNAVFTLTADWQRVTLTGLATTTITGFILETRGTFTTQTADILAWGAQIEPVTYQTTPSTYVATTASAYYGPRFDYDPVTLAPKGLLIEEARTNLLLYSEQFNNVYWTPTGATVSANTTSSPDGTVNADSLVEDTSTAVHRVFATPACSVSTVYTYTAYIKAAGRTEVRLLETTLGGAFFNLSTVAIITTDAGVTASIQDAGNGWRRCRITATTGAAQVLFVAQIQASAASNTIYTGNGTTALYLYGAQLEAGSFATSYIPTVASTVTRSADVATMTGTNFSSWYNQSEGTFVISYDYGSAASDVGAANRYAVAVNDGTFNNRHSIYNQVGFASSGLTVTGGATQAAPGSGTTIAANTALNAAYAFAVNNFAFSLNGGTAATDTLGTVPTVTQLNIGAALSTTAILNGHIRQIAYYNTRLPNAQLQTLTAPSLATTLSLSFTNQAYTVGV